MAIGNWYVVIGQPNDVAKELRDDAVIRETLQRPGLTGEHVLVVSGAAGWATSLPETMKVSGSYATEAEAIEAARELADQA